MEPSRLDETSDREAEHMTRSDSESRGGNDDGLRLRWLGHSTVLLRYRGDMVITDPFLRTRLYYLRRQTESPLCSPENEKSNPLILISHMHQDHLDIPSLRMLSENSTVVVPPGAGPFLSKKLPQLIVELGIGQELKTKSIRIVPVEAHHGGRRWPGLSAEAQGYVIHAGVTVYFAGDTDLFPSMEDIGTAHDLNVALLPVWGHGPKLGKHHMSPHQAAQALSLLGAELAVPIHWGTLGPVGVRNREFLTRPPLEFSSHASVLAPRADVRILEPCEEMSIDA